MPAAAAASPTLTGTAAAAASAAATATGGLEIEANGHAGLLALDQVPYLVLRLFRDLHCDLTFAHAWGPPRFPE